MSRIGKRVIAIPKGVTVQLADGVVDVKGPKGHNQFRMPERVGLNLTAEQLNVVVDDLTSARSRTMMGTVNAVLKNMVTGVSEGFTKRLVLNGVGYRALVHGRDLELTLGFSHPVKVSLPEHVAAQVEGNNQIVLTSHDNVLLGQVAANIRALRPPEPYQGKGIAYQGEHIRRKAGKTGKK
jgi:large subunit ribosomal protein L6